MSNKRNAKKPNRPPDGHVWIWQTADLLASPAWRGMSINARRSLDRIMLEFLAHAGKENGNLIVTHRDFLKAGVSVNFIADAIDELEHLRLIAVDKGKGGAGSGLANKFGLTWLPEKGSCFCDDIWSRTTQEHVKLWKSVKLKAAKCRARKMPKTARQGFLKTEPHSRISERATHGSVSEKRQIGNEVLELRAIPTHGSVSTFKTLQGDAGRSHPTAHGQAETCKKNSHTELARKFGDDARAWEVLTSLSPDTFQSLLSKMATGTIDANEIAAARLEAARSNQSASQQ